VTAPSPGANSPRDAGLDRWPCVALLLLSSVAFFHLTALPAFEDEGSQLRWIWRALEAGEWWLPLGEGKPLECWPMVPLIALGLPQLVAVRGVHVLAGMIGSVLIYRLALQVLDDPPDRASMPGSRSATQRGAALACGVIFAMCPFVVYLQRLALSDMLLCTAGIWVLTAVLGLLRAPTWSRSAAAATSLVIAALCKLPVGFIFILAMPLALVLMPVAARAGLARRPTVSRLLAANVPVGLLALLVCGIAFWQWRDGRAAWFGIEDLRGIGLGRYASIGAGLGGARPQLLVELTTQLSWPVVIVGSIGLAVSAWRGDWRQRWLLVMGLAPMLWIGFFTAYWYPRYLLFTLPPLIVCSACGWRKIGADLKPYGPSLTRSALALSVGFMGWQSARLVFDPLSARWSPLDRVQYIEGGGSGFGYPDTARFIVTATRPPAGIFALDGHSAYQLRIYLPPSWRGRVRPILYAIDGHVLSTEEARYDNLPVDVPVWFVIARPLLPRYLVSSFGARASLLQLRQIAAFDKPGSKVQLAIYEARRSSRISAADAADGT